MANHNRPSPFPFRIGGNLVIDEQCQCGHGRTEHNDTISYGQGACTRCDCVKYSWKKWVIVEDVNLCPSCFKGEHAHHQYDYMDAEGRVRVCRCSKCYEKR